MIEPFSKSEAAEVSHIPVRELDRQVMLGNFYPVLIADGIIAGCVNDETPAAGTARASR